MAEEQQLSPESKKVLYECFEHFDKSGDGVIDKAELPEALRFSGIDPTNTDMDTIIRLFDTNRDGRLQISELVENWYALCQHSVNGEELMAAFNKLDLDGDGYIKLKELSYVLTQTGEKWTPEEMEEFINEVRRFDENGDGKFAYPEFVALWASEKLPAEATSRV